MWISVWGSVWGSSAATDKLGFQSGAQKVWAIGIVRLHLQEMG